MPDLLVLLDPSRGSAPGLLFHPHQPVMPNTQVMTVVKSLVKSGMTICATIHSPTPYCFNLFDTLMILLRGNVVYFGENGAPCCCFPMRSTHTILHTMQAARHTAIQYAASGYCAATLCSAPASFLLLPFHPAEAHLQGSLESASYFIARSVSFCRHLSHAGGALQARAPSTTSRRRSPRSRPLAARACTTTRPSGSLT